MGLELRRGQLYYYRKRRVNGRVISEYIGTGPAAEAIAAQDVRERELRAVTRQHEPTARRDIEATDRALAALERMVKTFEHATLLANGFHTHKGQWRKQRVNRSH